MDTPHLRELAAADLDQAIALSTSAGWNQQLEDWRMLRTLAAGAAVAAASGPRLVGTALAIDYGGFAWIAMMLVEPAWRGRGLGAQLLEAAIGTVHRSRPIRLDATAAGRPLYRRHGFRDESVLTRLVAPAARPSMPHVPGDRAVRLLTPADLPVVAAQDARVFGGDRRAVLEWTFGRAPHYAFIVERDDGPPGYTFGRPGRLFDQVGPVVADDEASAMALVGAALASAAGRPIVIDAFDAHEAFCAWLRACGFESQRPLFRMRRAAGEVPARRPPGAFLSEYAILGPEFG